MVRLNERERAQVDAEAAAWLARVQGSRGGASEKGLQDWLRADPAHEEAFERATELWELIPGAAASRVDHHPANDQLKARHALFAAAASVLLLIALGGGYLWLSVKPVITTRVGQQQVQTLPDGTSVALNTDSQITVLYSAAERRVRLDRGEALFDVTHNPSRPFIVVAGDEEVRALGTSFVVKRDAGKVAVTLVRGRVEVTRHAADAEPERVAVLAPGDRAIIEPTGASSLDRPPVDSVTAWRRGEVVFDDTKLADAVTELNRYGGTRLIVSDPEVANVRVSGVFATNDTAEFADAIAQLNRFRLVQGPSSIEIRH